MGARPPIAHDRPMSELQTKITLAGVDDARAIGTIGCAYDGSPASRAALAWSASMAKRSGSRVRILTVHEPLASAVPAFHGIPMVAENSATREHLARRLRAAADDLRRAGVRVDASLLTGRAAAVLRESSSELDLIVIGSRGRGPTRAALLGSVSRALVRHAACPVVVVPDDGAAESFVEAGDRVNGEQPYELSAEKCAALS